MTRPQRVFVRRALSRRTVRCAAALAIVLMAGGAAHAGGWQPLTPADLADAAGGADAGNATVSVATTVLGNQSRTDQANVGNDLNGTFDTGGLVGNVIGDNHGITTVIQNTGNLSNLSNTVNLNVYLQ